MQIKERNLLNTCVRTFCSAGTKIPRHLLQKKLTQQWQTQPWWIKTMMNISLAKDHLWFSSLLQSYPASPPGPGAGDPEDISGGEEPATEGFKPHLPFPLSPATVRVRTSWQHQVFKLKNGPSWHCLHGAVGVVLNQMNHRLGKV